MADAGPQTRTKTAPWREIKSAIEEVQAMLDAAKSCTEDEVEMMMVEGIVSMKTLLPYGPAALHTWQRYCRARGVPNFEPGTPIEESFSGLWHLDVREDCAE